MSSATPRSAAAPPSATGELPGDEPPVWWLVRAVRWTAHLAVWGCVLVPTVVALARGFRPFGDDAAIASHAYRVFTLHPPLAGLATAASSHGHPVDGLGPLLFYLLSVPVRIDPARGLLWGAALFCGLVLSLAIEAAWSVGNWLVAALVALAALDLLWLTPVFENLASTAFFPVPFLLASVVFAWMVGTGRTSWWPVLVVSASVVAQCELFLVIPALALVVVALVLGLRRHRRWDWIPVGVGLGILCWLAPIVQQAEGPGGNLSAVLQVGRGQATLGASFALRNLGMASAPHPIWLTHLPASFFPLTGLETASPAPAGVVVLAVLAALTVGAILTGRRPLGSLSAVALALAVGLVVSVALLPASDLLSLGSLVIPFWVLGMVLWLVAGWTLLEAGRAALARWPPGARWSARAGSSPAVRLGLVTGLVALIGVGVADLAAAGASRGTSGWSAADVALGARATQQIEADLPPGPVRVVVGPGSLTGTAATEAIVYQLQYQGWAPVASGLADRSLELGARPGVPSFLVTLSGTRVVSVRRAG